MVEKKASSRKNSNGSSLFTAEDDQKLVEGYRKYGNNWKDISKEYFNGRFKTNQLFQRYKRVLVAKDKESTWSKNEDIELLAVYHHLDGSWVQMSKKYYKDTRTDNQLSNRWASLKKSCCLIDTFAKLKPNIKKDLYTLYKKVRKASGADMIKFTNYNEIVEIPEDAFPKIYLGEGRKVQKEGAKKRKTATKKESSSDSCDESSTKKRKTTTTTSTYVEEDSTSTSSDEEDEVSVDDVPVLPRVIPTRGQRVNYSKMLSDCEEEATEEEETKQSSPESEDEEDVQPQTQLSKQQVQWLQAQKCPAKRSSSSTAPSICNFDLACDEELDVAQQTQQQQPPQQTQQTVSCAALPVASNAQQQQQPPKDKQFQYTVIDNHDFNLNFNEDECLEIERFLGAPYSNYEQERTYSMEDIVAQTRIIKEYLEQTRTTVISSRQEEEQNPFLSLSDEFCETNDLELFDFSTFSRTAPKSPSLFDDLDF